MRPKATPGPPGLGMHREFETNRFANDCQARAYEEALPVLSRSRSGGALARQADGSREEPELIAEGVAA